MLLTLTLSTVLLLGALAATIRRVPAGQVYSMTRRGGPVRLLQPGMHLVWPLVERVSHKIQLDGQVLDFRQPLGEARDVRGRVYWQVLEPERVDAVFGQVDQLIRRGAQQALVEEDETTRSDCRAMGMHLKQALNQSLRMRGMMVTRVELDVA